MPGLVWLAAAASAQEDAPALPLLDPANPDSARLQQPREAFSVLPADKLGRPDWMRALREGAIRPRS
ncbi:MAG TPA: hypothetical protein VN649_00525, partial [Ramlibacter sp.]|nr:hypothetical protein [Ramlibacter sp.]